MKQSHEFLRRILANGTSPEDCAGFGITLVLSYQTRFSLHANFPSVTTKSVPRRSVIEDTLPVRLSSTSLSSV